MEIIKTIQSILISESDAIQNIPINEYDYEMAVNVIDTHVHNLGGKLVTSGVGKAGEVARNLATTFCSTGTSAVFLHPGEAQHGDLGILQGKDVLLIISNSGETRELIELIELKDELFQSIPVILITSTLNSPLANKADSILLTGDPKEVCPLGLTPTTSTTTMSVIGDILVVLMMKQIEFTAEAYYKRHHGGYLGQKVKEEIDGTKENK
jgi:arabinose-5-phosphate isomerase